MTITREEYLFALDVVEIYHKQLGIDKLDFLTRHSKKTLVKDWEKLPLCSVRLDKILKCQTDEYVNCYVEELKEIDVMRFRGCGKKSAKEFIELRDN